MNWITFNYACVYVCISNAQHFFGHSSLRKVSRKPKILNRMWCYLFLFTLRTKQQKWTYILFPVVYSAGSEPFPRDAEEAKLPKSNQDVPKG